MARAGPFGQESALLIAVHQALLHLLVHLRIDQVEQGEETAEGVPETGIGEVIARTDLACVRAVVNGLTVGIHLIERAGKEHRAIETRVERAQMVDVTVLHLDAAQHVVPALASVGTDLLKRAASQLLHVAPRLLLADERGCHTCHNLLTATCLHRHHHTLPVAVGLLTDGEVAVELHDEIAAEICRYTPAVLYRVSRDGTARSIGANHRAAIETVDHDIGLLGLWEREAHHSGTFRRRHLCHDIPVGQIHLIIIWCGRFSFM